MLIIAHESLMAFINYRIACNHLKLAPGAGIRAPVSVALYVTLLLLSSYFNKIGL